jgi:hypothetical protein
MRRSDIGRRRRQGRCVGWVAVRRAVAHLIRGPNLGTTNRADLGGSTRIRRYSDRSPGSGEDASPTQSARCRGIPPSRSRTRGSRPRLASPRFRASVSAIQAHMSRYTRSTHGSSRGSVTRKRTRSPLDDLDEVRGASTFVASDCYRSSPPSFIGLVVAGQPAFVLSAGPRWIPQFAAMLCHGCAIGTRATDPSELTPGHSGYG